MSEPTIFTVLLDGTVTPTPTESDAPRLARCSLRVEPMDDVDRRRGDGVRVDDGELCLREIDEDGTPYVRRIYARPSTFNRTEADLAIATEEWRRACIRARDEQVAFLLRPMPWERSDA